MVQTLKPDLPGGTTSLAAANAGPENGDAAPGAGTRYSVAPGAMFSGTISGPSDRDWVAIDLVAGQSYVFWVYGTNGRATGLSDPTLTLYGTNGATQLAYNDDVRPGENVFPLITFTAPTTGTYYLDVAGYGSGTGTYNLHVSSNRFSLDEIATFLSDFSWGVPTNIGFANEPGSTMTYNVTGLTPQGRQLAEWALEAWSNALGIAFVASGSSSAQLMFDDNSTGAFAGPSAFNPNTGVNLQSTINVGTGWLSSYGTTIDSYSYFTYLHEIGHALGLGHPGPYNGFARYGVDNVYLNDSTQATVMSYFSPTENTFIVGSDVTWLTPMPADLLAIHRTYGTPAAHAGNTTWGANSNVGGTLGAVFGAVFDGDAVPGSFYRGGAVGFTIHDTGGFDTVDLRGQSMAQRIDLRQEAASDVAGSVGNMLIARGTMIERAYGGSGNDTITGNVADNRLYGEGGNNVLFGGAGNDELRGLGGNDIAYGGTGRDRVYLGEGNDVFNDNAEGGFAGSDLVYVGWGNDTINGGGGNDTLHGMRGDDRITGNVGNDLIFAGPGQDLVWGGPGNDVLWAGIGNDTLRGGPGNDVFHGLGGRDLMWGGWGNDTINGGPDNDVIHGQNGRDLIQGGWGNDTLFGGILADVLRGGPGNDVIWGGKGTDRIDMGSGNDIFRDTNQGGALGRDTVDAGAGNDTILGAGGSDVFNGQSGNDLIRGGWGFDTINGGDGRDTLFGGNDHDVLMGGRGADRLEGGRGLDTLTGGAQADAFVFVGSRTGQDRITDFVPGLDQLVMNLNGVSRLQDLTVSDRSAGLYLGWAGGGVVLEGVQRADFSADDIVFL